MQHTNNARAHAWAGPPPLLMPRRRVVGATGAIVKVVVVGGGRQKRGEGEGVRRDGWFVEKEASVFGSRGGFGAKLEKIFERCQEGRGRSY